MSTTLRSLKFTLLAVFFFNVSSLKAQTVFITSKGKKYHSPECSLLGTDRKEISLEEAKKLNYKACSKCKAKQVKAIKKQEAEEKKKKQESSSN